MGARWSGETAQTSEAPQDAAKYKEPIAQTRAADSSNKPTVFSKEIIEFTFGASIVGDGTEEITITNNRPLKVKYKFDPAPSTQCTVIATPATGSIAPGKDKKVKLKVELKEKVNSNFKLTVHVGTEAHFLAVRVRAVSGVFGTDPSTLDKVTDGNFEIPEVLYLMKKSLLEADGLKSEGIFRLAGDVFEIAELKSQMNKKTFEKSDNVNTVATLIKVWYRELPTPILNAVPTETIFYSSDSAKCVEAYLALQEPSKTLLTWLLDLLADTTAHSAVNKMTPQNLAIVVAPNLYDSSTSDPMEGLVMSQKCVQFLNNLLLWYLEQKTGVVPEQKPAAPVPIKAATKDDSSIASKTAAPSEKRKLTRNQTTAGSEKHTASSSGTPAARPALPRTASPSVSRIGFSHERKVSSPRMINIVPKTDNDSDGQPSPIGSVPNGAIPRTNTPPNLSSSSDGITRQHSFSISTRPTGPAPIPTSPRGPVGEIHMPTPSSPSYGHQRRPTLPPASPLPAIPKPLPPPSPIMQAELPSEIVLNDVADSLGSSSSSQEQNQDGQDTPPRTDSYTSFASTNSTASLIDAISNQASRGHGLSISRPSPPTSLPPELRLEENSLSQM